MPVSAKHPPVFEPDPSIDPFEAKGILGMLWQFRKRLAPFMTYRLIAVLVTVPFPILTQRIIDESVPQRDINGIAFYSFIALVLILVLIFCMQRSIRLVAYHTQYIIRHMRARIFQKFQFLHFGFLDSTQTGRLLSKYAFDTQNMEGAIIPILNTIFPEIIRSVALIIALTFIDPWLLVFVLISAVFFAAVRISFFEQVKAWNHNVRMARERLTGQASEFISAIKLVRGFGQESVVRSSLDKASDAYSDSRRSQMEVNQTMAYLVFLMTTIINMFAVACGALLVIKGQLTLGSLVALIGALPVILNPITQFTQFSIQYFLARESYNSVKELVDSGYVEKWRGQAKLSDLKGRITFDNVTFSYPNKDEKVITHIDLDIKAGESVAFVGPSGSGKSTLINLILGLYAPTGGEIRIDGVPQRDVHMRNLRRQCAIVMQDNILLSGTLKDNIRFGRPGAHEKEVLWAAREANALEFIERLPEGLETKVGERGVSLSGGQRQRIAIARALLRNPRILILDEATSALDNESERLIQEALERLAAGRTTITIAHRLSTVKHVDRIVVLRSGRIIEEGSYQALAEDPESYFSELLRAH